jgi:hypothetical protein
VRKVELAPFGVVKFGTLRALRPATKELPIVIKENSSVEWDALGGDVGTYDIAAVGRREQN